MKNVIKLFSILFLVSGVVAFNACEKPKDPVKVTGVSLSKPTLSMEVGDEETLTATVVPNDAEDKAITWETSNDEVATIDATGSVTAVGSGKANITVRTKDGNFTEVCKVTVVPKMEDNYDVVAACEFEYAGQWYSSGIQFPVEATESTFSGPYNFSGPFRATITNVSGKTIPAGTPVKCRVTINNTPAELPGANVPSTMLIDMALANAIEVNAMHVIVSTGNFVISSETSRWGSNSICLEVSQIGKKERATPIKGCGTYEVKSK